MKKIIIKLLQIITIFQFLGKKSILLENIYLMTYFRQMLQIERYDLNRSIRNDCVRQQRLHKHLLAPDPLAYIPLCVLDLHVK